MKYVIYYRVSTKKQGESGLGLESQKAIISHFVPAEAIIAEFTEVKSGKNIAEREQLRAAIALCKKEKATLVVAKTDRLSRNTGDTLAIYEELEERLMCCDIPNTDKFTLTIIAAIAERERYLIGIRTRGALNAKKGRGEKLGNTANLTGRALAWEAKREKAKKLDNNKSATETIKLHRANGLTFAEIAERLNNNGFKASKGGKFSPVQVKRLFDRAAEV
jgi:DNA invertase Pin-like site-specific DNA recombinase